MKKFVASKKRVDDWKDFFLNNLDLEDLETEATYMVSTALSTMGVLYIVDSNHNKAEELAEYFNHAWNERIQSLKRDLQMGDTTIEYLMNEHLSEDTLELLRPYEAASTHYLHEDETYQSFLSLLQNTYKRLVYYENSAHALGYFHQFFKEYYGNSTSDVISYLKQDCSTFFSEELRGKLEEDLFSLHFMQLNVDNDPLELLKIFRQDCVISAANSLRIAGSYHIVLGVIFRLFDSLQAKKREQMNSEKLLSVSRSTNDEEHYEYSDVNYWESVLDGEINPDEDRTYDATSYDEYDDYYDYDTADTNINYKDITSILGDTLNPYLDDLIEALEYDVSFDDKLEVLAWFEDHDVYLGSMYRKNLLVYEEKKTVYAKLTNFAQEHNLLYTHDDYTFTIRRPYGFRVELTMHNPTAELKEFHGNFLSLFFHDHYNSEYGHMARKVFSTMGIELGEDYTSFLHSIVSNNSWDEHKTFSNGLKIHVVNHGKELRHSFYFV